MPATPRPLTLAFVAALAVVMACGCGTIEGQMKRDIDSNRCQRAAQKGRKWVTQALPNKLVKSRGRLTATRKLAKQHLEVSRQMLSALACMAADHNTIKALQQYRAVAKRVHASLPKSLQGPFAVDVRRLDKHTFDLEATLHYFQQAVPRGTLASFRDHRRTYPLSRYRTKAMQRELELASYEVSQKPTFRRLQMISRRYAEVPQAREMLDALWQKSARWELSKGLMRPDVLQLVRYLDRYAQVAHRNDLGRAVGLLKTAVQARVVQLHTKPSYGDLAAFLKALDNVKLPKGHERVRQWLDLRQAVVRRELAGVAFKEALRVGTRIAYSDYMEQAVSDPMAGPRIAEIKLALAIANQWAAMGADPDRDDVVFFLAERGNALALPAVKSLRTNPTIAAMMPIALAKVRGDECAAELLMAICKRDAWCAPHRRGILKLGKHYRKLKRVRKRKRMKAPSCRQLPDSATR